VCLAQTRYDKADIRLKFYQSHILCCAARNLLPAPRNFGLSSNVTQLFPPQPLLSLRLAKLPLAI
jgi:hypothetical protein